VQGYQVWRNSQSPDFLSGTGQHAPQADASPIIAACSVVAIDASQEENRTTPGRGSDLSLFFYFFKPRPTWKKIPLVS